MILNPAWVQTYYSIIGPDLSFRLVNFLSSSCHPSRKFAPVSKNNLATSFQEAPYGISMIGMESRIYI